MPARARSQRGFFRDDQGILAKANGRDRTPIRLRSQAAEVREPTREAPRSDIKLDGTIRRSVPEARSFRMDCFGAEVSSD